VAVWRMQEANALTAVRFLQSPQPSPNKTEGILLNTDRKKQTSSGRKTARRRRSEYWSSSSTSTYDHREGVALGSW
jgi:hypothetical protein